MADRGNDPERGPKGKGPESGRRVRGKPGTEQAKRAARERDRAGASTDRKSTSADPAEQTNYTGLAKKLESPVNDGDRGAGSDSEDE